MNILVADTLKLLLKKKKFKQLKSNFKINVVLTLF